MNRLPMSLTDFPSGTAVMISIGSGRNGPLMEGSCAKARCTVTLGIRKLLVVAVIIAVALVANVWAIASWLDRIGAIDCGRSIRAEYVTGTAITVIVALVILLPSTAAVGRPRFEQSLRCPVCDADLRSGGRYCPACGSRV